MSRAQVRARLTQPHFEYPGVREMLGAHCEMEEPRSDKTNLYSLMYGLFLWPLRELPSGKLLEIGLGCDQLYGPGASARAWRRWLPNLELWEAEYNEACVEKTRGKMRALGIHPLVGDQGNRTTLNRSVHELEPPGCRVPRLAQGVLPCLRHAAGSTSPAARSTPSLTTARTATATSWRRSTCCGHRCCRAASTLSRTRLRGGPRAGTTRAASRWSSTCCTRGASS